MLDITFNSEFPFSLSEGMKHVLGSGSVTFNKTVYAYIINPVTKTTRITALEFVQHRQFIVSVKNSA